MGFTVDFFKFLARYYYKSAALPIELHQLINPTAMRFSEVATTDYLRSRALIGVYYLQNNKWYSFQHLQIITELY